MIRINLLPYRSARRKENVRKQIFIYVLSLIILLFALFIFDFNIKQKINTLTESINSSKILLAKFKKKSKEVDELRKKLGALNNKLDVIKSLQNDRRFGIGVMEELTKVVVPGRVWFKNVKLDKKSIYFSGYSLDDRAVADFMRNLEKSSFFSNVELKEVSEYKIKNIEVRKFSINSKML
ncbi:MAG: hypothetical protein CSB21_03835 [Deltaproteobacteria bacterium]|nr:MAG: hypothetical protein CSB21_03835 [Deltaproteobacteria bacterium]